MPERTPLPPAELDVRMETSYIYDALLYHVYSTFGGFCLNIAGLTAIVLGGVRYYLRQHTLGAAFAFVLLGILIIAFTPVSLWFRAKAVMKQERYQGVIRYTFHDGGIEETMASGTVNHYDWSQIAKAVNTPKTITYYLEGSGAVLIFPKAAFTNETFQAAMRHLSRNVVMGKIYIH